MQVFQDVTGYSSYEELAKAGPGPLPLLPRDGPLSVRLHALLTACRQDRCAFMRTRLVRKGDASETAFLNLLVEDRALAGMSYVEFLCQLHRLIQNKMS